MTLVTNQKGLYFSIKFNEADFSQLVAYFLGMSFIKYLFYNITMAKENTTVKVK